MSNSSPAIMARCEALSFSHSLERAVCHVSAHRRWLYQSFQPSRTQMAKTSERQSQLQWPFLAHPYMWSLDWHPVQHIFRQMDMHTFLFSLFWNANDILDIFVCTSNLVCSINTQGSHQNTNHCCLAICACMRLREECTAKTIIFWKTIEIIWIL